MGVFGRKMLPVHFGVTFAGYKPKMYMSLTATGGRYDYHPMSISAKAIQSGMLRMATGVPKPVDVPT